MLSIGTLKLENSLILAPMAGITNLAFRLMVKRLGAGLVFSEMVSVEGLIRGHKKTFEYLKTHSKEKPLGVQIFGSKPESMSRATQMAIDAGADLIDINMGCPVKKVTKTGAGASLLSDPDAVARIVTAVRIASSVPVTAKIRAGWSPNEPSAIEISKIIEDCGADAISVHARFATTRYSAPADWSVIRQVKEKRSIPIIGNGDIFKAVHALKMKTQTGCDGVMIGRGAVGNPWLFKQINDIEQGNAPEEPSIDDRRDFIMEHFKALSNIMGEYKASRAMRGLLIMYSKGLPGSGRFREKISKIRDFNTLVSILDDYFSNLKEKTVEG